MARTTNRGRNNNPEGRNQYSSGWMDSAKDRPYTTAAVAAATVGAGVFLWSRRNQISDQLSGLSEQISDWSANMRSGSASDELAGMNEAGDTGSASQTRRRSSKKSQADISAEALTLKETGRTEAPVA